CSFERIYFSRGSDKDIYQERMKLGNLVCDSALKEVDFDLENSVFSFIPNTAETAFYGMIKRAEEHLNAIKKRKILALGNSPTDGEIEGVLQMRARIEKLLIKDAKLRTFITQDDSRDDMVAHIYDITYGTVRRGQDNVIVIDDSIVRGTTLKQSVVRILDRLGPKKIVIASSAPQIRYPDCYGIDMAKMGDFIAFEAAVALLKERKLMNVLDEVYEKCKAQEHLPKEQIKNYVKEIYSKFSADEISNKISELLTPPDLKSELKIIYLSIEELHQACPNHTGDWYFTGNYPTPGGNKVVNKSFIYYMEGKNIRAY
ncbi:MAG: amidophosphoribosyltransferase, partial [Crocinitomicaceae bacterium]|nr:amidophosphoribosyltransferase [Crocinitomicaceae bacterium]